MEQAFWYVRRSPKEILELGRKSKRMAAISIPRH